VQEVLLALEQFEEAQITIWSGHNDRRGALTKEALALLSGIFEEPKATISRVLCGNLSEATPGHTLAQIGSQGLIVESRGSNGHVTGSPGDVWDASSTNIPRVEVLEVRMDPRMTLIFASSISSTRYHIKAIEAQSGQLLLSDSADLHSFLARAVHDVPRGGV
jgi:hypothetical protein